MSPAWFAFIRQVPAVTIVTVVPETVQTELVAGSPLNATVSPLLAVAVTVNVSGAAIVRLIICVKVIVCVDLRL